MASVRQIDPEVGKARSLVSNAVKSGLDDEIIEEYRQELAEARIIAAAKAVAARLPELPPEKRERVRALLGGA
jgi:hypothetical protein